ncbi:oligosaccharide flippase family protein [Alteraurantiacibacter palmitatis]|uniref:Oligosaccharide flippase family protein n=1 Tax=Alteraurantiacibacter palmitatis TaxID=2054628 RepID=A0ABV7E883_9SPHN
MKIARNAALNVAGDLSPIITTLISAPLYLSILGQERYGVLVLVWTITGYLGFFDLGLGLATRYEMARRSAISAQQQYDVLWTSTLLSLGLGALGAMVMYLAAWFAFGTLIDMAPDLRAETLSVLPWIGVIVALNILNGVMFGALSGQERFLAVSLMKLASSALSQFVPLIAVILLGASLGWAVPASALGTLLLTLMLVPNAAAGFVGRFRPRFLRQDVKQLFSYGLWSSGASFGRQMLSNGDRFFIGSLLGAGSVALYTVPMSLMQRAATIPRSVVEVIFPRIARAKADDLAQMARRVTAANMAFGTLLSVGAVLAIHPFISIWINPRFADEVGLVAELAAITILSRTSFQIPAMILHASGRPRVTMTILMLELLPFFAGIYFATLYFGATGAVCAVLARGFIDALLLSWRAGTLGQMAPILLQSVAIVAAAVMLAQALPQISPAAILAKGVFGLTACGWALWVAPDLRNLATIVLQKLRRQRRA